MPSVHSATPAIAAVLFALDPTAPHPAAPAGPEAYAEWKRLEVLHVQRYLDGHSTMHGQRRDRVREMTGLPYTDAEADAWFTAYRVRMESELHLFDDTLAALQHIDTELCVPTGIVTNMDTDYQLLKM